MPGETPVFGSVMVDTRPLPSAREPSPCGPQAEPAGELVGDRDGPPGRRFRHRSWWVDRGPAGRARIPSFVVRPATGVDPLRYSARSGMMLALPIRSPDNE